MCIVNSCLGNKSRIEVPGTPVFSTHRTLVDAPFHHYSIETTNVRRTFLWNEISWSSIYSVSTGVKLHMS